MYARNIVMDPGMSCFLLGPRGTGKTYWLRHRFPNATFVDLLEAQYFNALSADPGRLSQYLPRKTDEWVVIDEIQKLPPLLDEIHRLIEKDGYRFILTGSSARKLKRSSSNLLGGRAAVYHLYPLTASELGPDFDLGKAVEFGMLPTLYDKSRNPTPDRYLQGYVQTYLQEEVAQEGLTRNLGAFSRFLEAASFSQGQVLNVSEIARECHIKQKLAQAYFEILDDLLIGVRVPVFRRRAKRRMVQHPKFYLFDAGVFRAIRPMGLVDTPSEVGGLALETLVFHELRVLVERLGPGHALYYWRTSSGMEVDFVVYGPDMFTAVEVKSKRSLTSRDIRGLEAFRSEYPSAKGLILYGGDQVLSLGDISAVPVEEGLVNLTSVICR